MARGTMAAAVNGNTRRGEQVGGEGPVQKRMLMWERIPTQRDKSILYMVEVIGLQAETWKGKCRGSSHATTVLTHVKPSTNPGLYLGG